MRAIVRRTMRIRDGSGRLCEADLKRMSKSSFFMAPNTAPSSASLFPRISSIFMSFVSSSGGRKATDHLDLDGQLVGDALERRTRLVLRESAELHDNGAGLDLGGPELDFALAGAHAHFGGLRRDRLLRGDAGPHARLSVRRAAPGAPAGFDLAGREPAVVERLQTEIAERHPGTARRGPPQSSPGGFSGLCPLW